MLKATQNPSKSRILSSPLVISGSRFPQRRHLASPSKPVNAAAAALRKPKTLSYSIPNSHVVHHPSDYALNDTQRLEMRSFLRQKPLIILPTPRPPKYSAPSTSEYHKFFPETVTLDKFAIMHACLKNNLDVPRAHQLFTEARKHDKLKPLLDTQAYNAFLTGYFDFAEEQEQAGLNATMWRDQAWKLYSSMEEAVEGVEPDLSTYTIMLRAISRSPGVGKDSRQKLTKDIMAALDRRKIQLSAVIHHDLIRDSQQDVQQLLTQAATSSGSRQVIAERLAELGVQPSGEQDVLHNVSEIKTQVKKKIVKEEVDGEEVNREVAEVPYNLGVLRETLGRIIEGRKALPDDVLQRQRIIEETAYESALARFKHEAELFKDMRMGGSLTSKNMKVWIWEWYTKTIPLLKERIAEIKEEESGAHKKKRPVTLKTHTLPVYSFLSLLQPEKLVIITILELMTMIGSNGYQGGIKTTRGLLTIGAAIEAEHHFQQAKKQNIPAIDFKSRADLPTYSVAGYLELHRERVKAKLEQEGTENWLPAWTPDLRVRVGAIVMDALMESATVTVTKSVEGEKLEEEQDAFYNTYRYENGFKIGLIKANDFIIEKMAKEPDRDSLHPRHLPMLAPPRPWIRHNSGGYLYSNMSVMRMKESSEQNSYLKEADARGAMELVYASLDVLGKTAWKINQPVFEVALEVWNKGLEYPRIPPLVLKQTLPEPPVDSSDMVAKSQYANAMRQLVNDRNSHHSDRCSANYKMEIARTFIGEKFYLPHNIDFRGRAYPIPPHLNHMGDDLSRGLLMFAESKPLGKTGLRWMKIHLSNLFGYDKASFDDREVFATEHLSEIYDSAENPITGQQWWLKADDPWQCLAVCMELRNALESPDPEKYESCLPVHQDGTCNGLQHYAALGGDVIGAKQVNLDVSDRPSDVYTYVSEMVKAQIDKDAAEENEFAIKLQGSINRKVVKQTVMTTVYGVTFIGAREQIGRQLKNITGDSTEDTYPAANYLAKVTLNCIGTLFKGAKDIQLWLNNCAKLISRSVPEDRLRSMLLTNQGNGIITEDMSTKEKRLIKADRDAIKDQMTTVIWTTLLGLPIVQPYRRGGRKQILTSMQSVYISDPNQPQPVNTVKQASAFPPNFVHSLDATHMMLTALQCDREGMIYAAVHDSYWTHAATVDEMSTVIRDSFIHLHSSNVLENLLKELHERYRDYKLPIEALTQRSISKWIVKDNLPEHIKVSLMALKDDHLSEENESDLEGDEEDATADPNLAANKSNTSTTSEVAEPRTEKKTRRSTPRKADISKVVDQKYVNLIDVLPPVPEKGKFDIQVVKDSSYFFS